MHGECNDLRIRPYTRCVAYVQPEIIRVGVWPMSVMASVSAGTLATDTIAEEPIGGILIGISGVAIGIYYMREGRKWQKKSPHQRAEARLGLLAGRLHRHPELTYFWGLLTVVIFGLALGMSTIFLVIKVLRLIG